MTPTAGDAGLDTESCYRAVKSRDRRFDGVFYTAVRTTGIYCRPSCPARTPALHNVTFHPSAAAAQAAGYRACKRCLPDATPGSPDWDVAATAAGRAMRLIADGVVDREGVDGLAARLGYTSRHLARRAHRRARRRAARPGPRAAGADRPGADRDHRPDLRRHRVRGRLLQRPPVQRHRARGLRRRPRPSCAAAAAAAPTTGAVEHAARRAHAVRRRRRCSTSSHCARSPGVEAAGDGWYARTLDLPHGTGTRPARAPATCSSPAQTAFVTGDVRPRRPARHRGRRRAGTPAARRRLRPGRGRPTHFAGDPVIGPLVRRGPGLRVPGHVDGHEIAVRAVLGQQVSVAGARTVAARLVAAPRPADRPADVDGLTHLFPDAATLAALDPERPADAAGARPRADRRSAPRWPPATIALDRGPDRDDVRRALLALPGIGPWTADYIALRALGHPDVFLPTDIGIRDALTGLGRDPARAADSPTGWRPWRSYAQLHLWQHSLDPKEN